MTIRHQSQRRAPKPGALGHGVYVRVGRRTVKVGSVMRDCGGRWWGVVLLRRGAGGWDDFGARDAGGAGYWFKSRRNAVAAVAREAVRG